MAIQVTIIDANQQIKIIKLESGGQLPVVAGENIRLLSKSNIKLIRKGTDLIVKDVNGYEYTFNEFYEKLDSPRNVKKITWKELEGDEKELLSEYPADPNKNSAVYDNQEQVVVYDGTKNDVEAISTGNEPAAVTTADVKVAPGVVVAGDNSLGYFVLSLMGMGGIYSSLADEHVNVPPPMAKEALVANVNEAPNIVDSTVSLAENLFPDSLVTNLSDSFTGTDLDRDGTAINYSITGGNTDGIFTINSATGAIAIAAGKTLDYETATSHLLTVSASDGTLTDTATITVYVTNVNDAPVAMDDSVTVNGGTVFNSSISLLANDTDVDGPGKTAVAGIYSTAQGGILDLSANGQYTYTPATGFSGADTVNYTVTDGLLNDTGLLTINVAAEIVAPAPTAIATIYSIGMDTGANDDFITSDNDGLWVSFTLNESLKPSETVWYSNDNGAKWQDFGHVLGNIIITQPDGAPADCLGALIFDTALTQTNTVKFQVRNADGIAGPTTEQLVTIDTTAPTTTAQVTAVIDDVGTIQGTVINSGVTDDTGLAIHGALSAPLEPGETVRIYDGTIYLGNAAVTGTTWIYTDDTLTIGDIASYTARVADIAENQSEAGAAYVVTIAQDPPPPVNQSPVTTPVTLNAIAQDSGIRVITQAELLGNASDIDGPSLSAINLAIVTGNGTLVDNGNGTWNYTPATNDDTAVSFSYTVTDGSLTAAGSATLDITPVNDAPVVITSYADNVGVSQNVASIAASTDDAMPGINIGPGLSGTPSLYVDGVRVASSYNIVDGTLTPINPLVNGAHTFSFTETDAYGKEGARSTELAINTTAKIYYVSPDGIDSNNGLSISASLKTINAALDKAVFGDTVYLLTGTYEEYVSINKDGITLTAYQGNKPVIDGQNLSGNDWESLISIGGDYNLVSGIELKNCNINGAALGGDGIQISGVHNTVSNMNVHHIWQQGIQVNGDYNTVEYSTIWQASRENINSGASSGWGSGLSAGRNDSSTALVPGVTSYATLRYNEVYNNWGEGVSLFEAANSVMEGNISYDNWTVNLYLSDTTGSLVKDNLVYISDNPAIPTRNNGKVGIFLGDEVVSVPRSANNIVINNMVYNASFGAFSYTEVSSSGLQNVLIANNTVVGGKFSTGDSGSGAGVVNFGTIIENNIFLGTNNAVPSSSGIVFSNNNWGNIPALAQSSTDVVGDPLLARTGLTTAGNLTPEYFKLLAGSPVIDKGASLSDVAGDYFNTPRDSTPDIGAHEVSISPNANITISASDTSLRAMFYNDTAFNQNVSGWDTGAVTDMSFMFSGASTFNQDISGWDVSSLITADQMLDNSAMSSDNYDNLLAGWADVDVSSGETGLQTGVSFGAKGAQYSNVTDKQYLIDNYGWVFTDGGFVMDVAVGSNFVGDALDLSAATTAQTAHGLGGNDNVTGSDFNDLLVGGVGNDTLTGGAGADTFSYRHANEGDDVITDFTNGAGGDHLDIHHLLDGATQATIASFVTLSDNGGKVQFNIDADGNASGTDVSITLQNISYSTASSDALFLQNMMNNGNLVI